MVPELDALAAPMDGGPLAEPALALALALAVLAVAPVDDDSLAVCEGLPLGRRISVARTSPRFSVPASNGAKKDFPWT